MAEEKVFTINLKREFKKDSRWKKSNRASREVRRYLEKHMKSDDVKIGSSINEEIWRKGDQKPPSKIKVRAVKDDDGTVKAELFGFVAPEVEEPKEEKKKDKKEEKKEKPEKKEEPKDEKPKKEKSKEKEKKK